MSHTISDARKRVNEVCHCGRPVVYGFDGDLTHTRGLCERCDAVRCDAYPGECQPTVPPPTVPRVARSVDDLRAGMVVVSRASDDEWEGSYCYRVEPGDLAALRKSFADVVVVILSDPPARDWLVPATQMEALREAVRHFEDPEYVGFRWVQYVDAVDAVLDAAREVEHE